MDPGAEAAGWKSAVDELCFSHLVERRAPHGTFVLPGARERARSLHQEDARYG